MNRKRPILLLEDDRKPAKEYSRVEALEYHPTGRRIYIGGYPDCWTAVDVVYTLCVMGSAVFWKENNKISCTYKDGKIYGSISPFVEKLCKVFHLDWITQNSWVRQLLVNRNDLWKAVFAGKITNPEKLCRYVSKKYFKGVYSYKAIKGSCTNPFAAGSLWRIYHYTTNPEYALRNVVLLDDNTNEDALDYRDLFRDALEYAEYLNEKLNPLWSYKRLHAEHQNQIERKTLMQIKMNSSKLSDELLSEPFSEGDLSLILDERTCFVEGCMMHNCVYSCYWKRIKNGTYLIAKGYVNGEYIDLGIDEDLTLSQVHTRYNKGVLPSTYDYCESWIKRNAESLKSTMTALKEKSKKYVDTFPW